MKNCPILWTVEINSDKEKSSTTEEPVTKETRNQHGDYHEGIVQNGLKGGMEYLRTFIIPMCLEYRYASYFHHQFLLLNHLSISKFSIVKAHFSASPYNGPIHKDPKKTI